MEEGSLCFKCIHYDEGKNWCDSYSYTMINDIGMDYVDACVSFISVDDV